MTEKQRVDSLHLIVITGDTNTAGPAPVLEAAYTPTVYSVEGCSFPTTNSVVFPGRSMFTYCVVPVWYAMAV